MAVLTGILFPARITGAKAVISRVNSFFSFYFQSLPKRFKPSPATPFHLWEISEDFDPISVNPDDVCWVRSDGSDLPLNTREMTAFNEHIDQHFIDSLLQGQTLADASLLAFRDPNHFVAGQLHRHPDIWSRLLESVPASSEASEVLNWIRRKVDISDFFVHFKGSYGGENFDSMRPPSKVFANHPSCKPFAGFISETILDRFRSGAISLWGKVGDVDPPLLVMPLTVEPSKPRLCNDDRFLNLWMADRPFKLDTLPNLTCYVNVIFPCEF